jgi:RNA recognition motif-containing protein
LKFIPSDLIGSVRIVKSKKTKKSKGYGFVEIKDQELAQFLTKGSIKHIKELINESQESNEGCIFVLNERKLDF